jgi:tetratricopeptide (TPR) repeat protein
LRGHRAPVLNAAFSEDGTKFLSIGRDGVKEWNGTPLPPEVLYDRKCRSLVTSLYDQLVTKDRVAARVRADPALDDAERRVALHVAENFRPDANVLNTASWEVVSREGHDREAYTLALRRADEACRLAPGDGNILNTLGAAWYRLGDYEAALKTLTKSDQINRARYDGSSHPLDLALLAMVHHRLGHRSEAVAMLDRLRKSLKVPPWNKEGEVDMNLVSEAERLIQGAATGGR